METVGEHADLAGEGVAIVRDRGRAPRSSGRPRRGAAHALLDASGRYGRRSRIPGADDELRVGDEDAAVGQLVEPRARDARSSRPSRDSLSVRLTGCAAPTLRRRESGGRATPRSAR